MGSEQAHTVQLFKRPSIELANVPRASASSLVVASGKYYGLFERRQIQNVEVVGSRRNEAATINEALRNYNTANCVPHHSCIIPRIARAENVRHPAVADSGDWGGDSRSTTIYMHISLILRSWEKEYHAVLWLLLNMLCYHRA